MVGLQQSTGDLLRRNAVAAIRERLGDARDAILVDRRHRAQFLPEAGELRRGAGDLHLFIATRLRRIAGRGGRGVIPSGLRSTVGRYRCSAVPLKTINCVSHWQLSVSRTANWLATRFA